MNSISEKKEYFYSLIIPTYNERENIGILIYLIYKHLTENNIKFEIIIVDDNSPDKTYEIVENLQKNYSPEKIKLIKRSGKLGLGSAYIDGSKISKGDFIFLMDADLSHHPKYLIDFIRKQQESYSDIVTGTRYSNGGGVYGWNYLRKFISRGANFFASFFLKPHISDLTGSFRLYRKDHFMNLISLVKNSGYAFQMEIIVRAQYQKLKIAEIPITFVDRLMGKSKLGMNEIIIYLKTVFTLYREL